MVRIIDGEIVQDDDPRLQQGAARRPTTPSGGPAGGGPTPPRPAAAQSRSVFDFSAPALRVVPDETGAGLGGLPNVVVFGALVRAQHLLMLAALGIFMGWRGMVVGGILWYVWMANGGGQPQQPHQQPGDQHHRIAAAQNYFNNMFQQAPLGRGGSGVAGASSSGAGGPNGSKPSSDPWANKGKAYKLSG